jgi:hypothetical protein
MQKRMSAIAIQGCALFAVLGTVVPAMAQDAAAPYSNMAPLEQYLMDLDAEIALARSAAPESISRDAEVLILGRQGYETAVAGKNGWVCMVERGWLGMFDHPEFWNPKIRAADCLNPPAARSLLPYVHKRTELLLAGRSKPEVIAALKAAIDKKELPALEKGTVSYMMSRSSYLTDQGHHNLPHLMFFETSQDDAAWGANLTHSPVLSVHYWYLSAEAYPELETFPPLSVFLVAVDKWSDGTRAPSM